MDLDNVIKMIDTSNFKNKTNSEKFTLKEILQDDSEFVDYLHKKIWHKVKSSPSWLQFKDANIQLKDLATKSNNLERKLDELLIAINNGNGGKEYAKRTRY